MIEALLAHLGVARDEAWFWGLHSGAELDLLVVRGQRRLGFEVKRTDSPRLTPSLRSAMETLRLDHLDVVHAGAHTFPLADGVRAVPLSRLLDDVAPLS